MELATRPEPVLDFAATARMAAEAFGLPAQSFRPERLRWLYDRAFSEGSTVLSLYAGEAKVGQVALVRQRVRTGAGEAMAIALIDLFIMPAYRSREAIAGLYGEVERLCQAHDGPRLILAVPNGKAAGVNARFLGLQSFLKMEIRAGATLPVTWRGVVSGTAAALGRSAVIALAARVLPGPARGLAWTPETLWERLQDPAGSFGVHATDDLLLVSSRRVLRRVPHTLLCAFFARGPVRPAAVRAVTAAACAQQGRPLFVYVGVNRTVPLPGWPLPERLRPSLMGVQIRDFRPDGAPVDFDRFESLDFDFA